VDRSNAQGAFVKAPKAPRGVGCKVGVSLSPWWRLYPPQNFFLLFDLKMEHFGTVFKLDLTEERRTQLRALASYCSGPTPMNMPINTRFNNTLLHSGAI